MSNLERAKRYMDVQWTNEQKQLLHEAFSTLDHLLLTCQTEGNKEKINHISEAHISLHDLVLADSIKDMVAENFTDEYYEKLGFVQIELLIDVQYGDFVANAGDYRWTTKSDAEECVWKGFAKIVE